MDSADPSDDFLYERAPARPFVFSDVVFAKLCDIAAISRGLVEDVIDQKSITEKVFELVIAFDELDANWPGGGPPRGKLQGWLAAKAEDITDTQWKRIVMEPQADYVRFCLWEDSEPEEK